MKALLEPGHTGQLDPDLAFFSVESQAFLC